MRSPTISERVSFRWLPDPPSEPTTTLVLTSPKGHFVDVRILHPTSSPSASPSSEPTLQWAFAGLAAHETTSEGRSKGTWIHLVDSKHPEGGFVDSGIFEDLPDGNSLEKGTMLDDETGQMRDYEEVWHDYPPEPESFKVVQTVGGGATGFFIMMGPYALGVMQTGNGKLGVSKWEKSDPDADANGDDERGGKWVQVFASGELADELPVPLEPFRLRLPSSRTWEILEG